MPSPPAESKAGPAGAIPPPHGGGQAEVELSGDTRECPYCAETIKAAARRCPYCREFLDPWVGPAGGDGGPAGEGAYVEIEDDLRLTELEELRRKSRDALIFSILGLFCCMLLSIVGLVRGISVNRELSRMGYPKNGLATAAVVIGWVSIGLFLAGVLIELIMGLAMSPGGGGASGW